MNQRPSPSATLLSSAPGSRSLHPRRLLFHFGIVLTYLFIGSYAKSSNASTPTDFSALLNQTAPLTLTITTDQEAVSVVSSLFDENSKKALPTRKGQSTRGPKTSLPDELAQLGVQFIQEIAIFHWASQWQDLIQKQPVSTAQSEYETQRAFLDWINGKETQPDLKRVLSLIKGFLELSTHSPPANETWIGYQEFAQRLLETYPVWTGSNSAWLTVAEREGASGILQRLESYWKINPSQNAPWRSDKDRHMEAFIGRFLQQQIIPIFKAHLEASLFLLQSKSERYAWEAWQQVQEWKTLQHERRDLARLCGTWQWLIHNHQNHGDHKTVMVYPPPSQYERMDPKPAKIQVQGDTVYIRWEFPNGIIQEESLLLSEKDRMLTGTFTNNVGPHGNITGRRIAPCQERQN